MTEKAWDDLVDPARIALEKLITEGDTMADSIEELEAKLAKVEVLMSAGFAEYERRLAECEARLGKAVQALDKIKRIDNLVGVFAACERTLAELTGGKDD